MKSQGYFGAFVNPYSGILINYYEYLWLLMNANKYLGTIGNTWECLGIARDV